MKFIKILFFTLVSCMMLTACPGSDEIDDLDPNTPGGTTGGENTPGGGDEKPGQEETIPTGIDDLHNTTSDKPAYSPARK